MLLRLPFLLVVVVVLPALAWSSHRWAHSPGATDAAVPAIRVLGWQTVVLQTAVAGLAFLAIGGGEIEVIWWSSLTPRSGLLAVGLVAGALLVSWLEGRRPLGPHDSIRRRLREIRPTDPLWLLATVAAAVSEELAYRGVLTGLIGLWIGLPAGAAVSALAFGLGHLGQGWRGAAFSAAFGLGLQGLVAVSGGLGLAILAHGVYDLGATAMGRRLRVDGTPGPR
jgi:membrane protease YdiL (CAAX protease family)